jgi:hypothetical protein
VRNVWKGLVIGGLTGAAAGLALDLGERGARGASALGEAMAQHAPEVADHVRHTVAGAVSAASDRARHSEIPAQAKATSAAAQDKVSAAVSEGVHHANDVVGQGKKKAAEAVYRAKDAASPS